MIADVCLSCREEIKPGDLVYCCDRGPDSPRGYMHHPSVHCKREKGKDRLTVLVDALRKLIADLEYT